MLRSVVLCLAGILTVTAQIPSADSRVTNVPGTNTHFTMPSYPTVAEWETRKTYLRKQILYAAGLDPMPEKTPLHAQIFGKLDRGDYTIEKVQLETMPGFYLGGNLFRPTGKSGKLPGILSTQGQPHPVPHLFGVLGLASSRNDAFQGNEASFLGLVSNQIALADTPRTAR